MHHEVFGREMTDEERFIAQHHQGLDVATRQHDLERLKIIVEGEKAR